MNYTKKNIHFLRRYAKTIGVGKPTTFTKARLIEKILEVEQGRVAPKFSKIGRPMGDRFDLEEGKLIIEEKKKIILTIDKTIESLQQLKREIESSD